MRPSEFAATSAHEPSDAEVIARQRARYRGDAIKRRILDAILGLVLPRPLSTPIARPRRVLLANYGHLGDLVMSTACMTVLKETWPDVEIGWLIGKWSRAVLDGHPYVSRLHVVNHWFMDRGPPSRLIKAPRYWMDCRRVSREIRAVGYNAAIDLRAYYPNAIPVLRAAGVPVRVGYSRVGFGPMLTHPREFVYQRKHESEVQLDLLRAFPIPEARFASPKFCLAPADATTMLRVEELLHGAGFGGKSFRVLHIGASVAVRDWPTKNWRELAERLVEQGCRLVFTGHGVRDRSLIQPVIDGLPQCVDLCSQLDFAGFAELLRRAEVVYTVETVAGHVAVAVGTPCVGIYGGMSDWRHWAPRPGASSICVTHPVPCWPCFLYNGCAEMTCLRELPAAEVYEAGERVAGGGRA